MDSKILSQSFLSAPSEVLAGQLAVLDQTTLARLLKSKAADWFSEQKGEFNRLVEESAHRLAGEQPAESVLRLFGELNSLLEIPPRRYATPRDFEDNCGEIVSRCLVVLRESEPGFEGTDLTDMMRFLTNKMFGEIGKRFESLSDEKKQQAVAATREFIEQLPESQREKLRKEIGADQITDAYILKALVSGTLSTAFAAAVGTGGFAFYTGAVSLLATLAGFVGITLPFSVYVGLTSTIAVMANPVFFLPLLAGGGFWFYGRQNNKMRRQLAPLIVMQLVLSHMAGRANSLDHSDEALELWTDAWAVVEEVRSKLAQAKTTLAATRQKLYKTGREMQKTKERISHLKKEQDAIQSDVKTRCCASAVDIARSVWGVHLHEAGQRLKSQIDALAACRIRQVRPGLSGIPDLVRRTFDVGTVSEQVELAALAAVRAVISASDDGASAYPADIRELVDRYRPGETNKKELAVELADLQQKESSINRQAAVEDLHRTECQLERDRVEGRYWGLAELR